MTFYRKPEKVTAWQVIEDPFNYMDVIAKMGGYNLRIESNLDLFGHKISVVVPKAVNIVLTFEHLDWIVTHENGTIESMSPNTFSDMYSEEPI